MEGYTISLKSLHVCNFKWSLYKTANLLTFNKNIYSLCHVHAYGLYNVCLLGPEVMIDPKENLIQLRLRLILTHCQNTAVSICNL